MVLGWGGRRKQCASPLSVPGTENGAWAAPAGSTSLALLCPLDQSETEEEGHSHHLREEAKQGWGEVFWMRRGMGTIHPGSSLQPQAKQSELGIGLWNNDPSLLYSAIPWV